MNDYQRTTMRFLRLVGLLATVLSAASPRTLVAEIFINPAPLGAYYWQGSHDGNQIGNIVGNNSPHTFTGGGDADNWDRNWNGRYQVDADSGCQELCQPGTFMGLPPEDGDAIFFKDSLIPLEVAGPYSISGGSVSLPSSNVFFEIHADFSGGSYDVASIGILTRSIAAHTGTFPVNFNGTSFSASEAFRATAVHDTLTLQGATIFSPLIELSGGYIDSPTPPPDGRPRISITGGSQVIGSVAEIAGSVLVDVDNSAIELLGAGIGFGNLGPDDFTELRLTGGTASFAQFLQVGAEGSGRLTLDDSAQVDASEAYVNIGDLGRGFMHVTQNSEIHIDELNVGILEQGDVAVDSGGKVYSTTAHVGMINGHDGTVNVEGGEESAALWDTDDVTVGSNGNGYVYIRNHGTLKIDHEGVLGLNPNSRGVLNLIGANAHLELGPMATLAIGKEGVGELNLSEGAKFTSNGDVNLGEMVGGSGVVTIDGQNSHWTVEGDLIVGQASVGRVEVKNKGKLTLSQGEFALGTEDNGDGTLLVMGDESTLDFEGDLVVGEQSKGTVEVSAGASVKVAKIALGFLAGSEGTLNVSGSGQALTMFETTEAGSSESPAFIVGEFGKGTMNITDGAQLTSAGAAVLASDPDSSATVNVTGFPTIWKVKDLTVGKSGQATVTINQGWVLSDGDVVIGHEGTKESTVTVTGTGSKLEFKDTLTVGKQGKGKLIVDGGAVVESAGSIAEVEVADEAAGGGGTSTGTLEVKGQNSKLKSSLFDAGAHGVATVTLSNKATIESDEVRLGAVAGAPTGAKADVTVTDATWTITDSLDVLTAGSLTLSNHGKVDVKGTTDNSVTLDGQMDRPTKITIDGMGSELKTLGGIVVGVAFGNADLFVKGGGRLATVGGEIGGTNLSSVSITGGDSAWSVGSGSGVAVHGNGLLSIQLGGSVAAERFSVHGSSNDNATATLLVDGPSSTLVAVGPSFFADGLYVGNGRVAVSGAAQIFASSVRVGGDDLAPADVEISGSGSKLSTVGTTTVSSGQLVVNQGTMETNRLIFDGPSGRVRIDGASAELTADTIDIGSGIAGLEVLNGAHATANTAKINGILIVSQDGSLTLGSTPALAPLRTVQVNPGGLLYGNGRLFGNLIVKKGGENQFRGGVFKPGNSPGTFTVEGDVTIEEGGVLEIEIGGLAAGSQHDQVVATGSMTVNGILDLQIVNSGGGFQLPTIGDEFTLLSAAGGVSGAFENAASLRSVAGGSLVEWSLTPGANDAVLQATAITLLPDGDYNGNGIVDAADYTVWRNSLGGINLAADGNRDGMIDDDDYAVWKSNFGETAGSGSGAMGSNAAVPEPAAAVLWLIAASVACATRRRCWC